MNKRTIRTTLLTLASAFSMLMAGCYDEPSDPASVDPNESTDESENVDQGESEGDSEPWCLHTGIPGVTAKVHQCGGSATGRFGAAGIEISQYRNFGDSYPNYDSYSDPHVMACCTPFDLSDGSFSTQEHYKFCWMDFVQQFCRTAAEQIASNIEEAPLSLQSEVAALADWVADHQQECYDYFFNESGLHADIDDGGGALLLDVQWDLPDDAAWENLVNPFIEADVVEILDIYIPANAVSQIQCEDWNYNDGNIFDLEPGGSFPTDVGLASSTDADLSGPTFLGSNVSGTIEWSTDSYAVISDQVSGSWTLENMVFIGDGSFDVCNGATPAFCETVDRVRVSLIEPQTGAYARGSHTIAAGAAAFAFGAEVDGGMHMVVASNATSITMTKSGTTWSFDEFDVTYEDSQNDDWTLTINDADFQE